MDDRPVLVDIDPYGVATVRLNRPHRNNAYNGDMMEALLEGVKSLSADDSVRIIVLRGNGKYFQAGADLKWMNSLATQSVEKNFAMSQTTTDAVRLLNACPKPTIALVHGGCFGGGLGMMAACDIVIASREAVFSITEVRWGLVAGPIIPQLVDAMGLPALRRYALTGETFSAAKAVDYGLVHELCETGALDEAADGIIDALLKNSPSAISQTKEIMLRVGGHLVDDFEAPEFAKVHAERRRTEDAIEGLSSFNQRREASWYPKKK
ncbi:MAG: enoyl-CoA hydratase-related protein [Sneathiella sp.]